MYSAGPRGASFAPGLLGVWEFADPGEGERGRVLIGSLPSLYRATDLSADALHLHGPRREEHVATVDAAFTTQLTKASPALEEGASEENSV